MSVRSLPLHGRQRAGSSRGQTFAGILGNDRGLNIDYSANRCGILFSVSLIVKKLNTQV
jgi:hypothetical protein